MSSSTLPRLTATEVEQLDPYVLMAVLGKRVIHPDGRQSTEEVLRGRTCNPIRKCSMSAAAWERPRLKSHVAFAPMSQSSTSRRSCSPAPAPTSTRLAFHRVTLEQGVRPITDYSAEGDSQMGKTLSPTTRRRLDVQGFSDVNDATLAEVAAWLRMAFAMCAVLAGAGTALASPTILWALMSIAALAALFPVHPFDLIYNHGIRYFRNTGPLPKRRAQSRFACGVGAVWLVATAWAFQFGALTVGYILGAGLTGVAVLVSTTDICIPSMTYNALFRRS
jgi:Domain of unknown function (DUF4395)